MAVRGMNARIISLLRLFCIQILNDRSYCKGACDVKIIKDGLTYIYIYIIKYRFPPLDYIPKHFQSRAVTAVMRMIVIMPPFILQFLVS